jgi:hypothetical protein
MRRASRLAAIAAVASVALATGIGAALATGDDDGFGRRAVATLTDANGQKVGVVAFRERPERSTSTRRSGV